MVPGGVAPSRRCGEAGEGLATATAGCGRPRGEACRAARAVSTRWLRTTGGQVVNRVSAVSPLSRHRPRPMSRAWWAPGHRVACHYAEDILAGLITPAASAFDPTATEVGEPPAPR